MESVLRVCLFTASFLPLVGGAERCADLVVRGLIARGHEAMVLAQRTGALPGELPYRVRHYRRPPWQHLWPEVLAWPLVKAHRAWRFEVILAFDSYPCGYPACWIKKRLGVAVVVSPRGEDVQEGFFALRKPRVAACLAAGYRNADRIIAISGWAAERVRAIAGPPPNSLPPIDLVYNGIDMDADASLRAQAREQGPSLPVAKPFILHLARVDQRKQQTTAIRAVHMLREEFRRRGLKYAIAGDGHGMDEVRRVIGELGVGDIVVCLGTRTGLDKAWLYDNALFCVAAALWETFGNVLIEAMAAGQPILASDIPTHREIVAPHQAGLFFKTGDPGDMARQLMRMLDEAPGLRAAAQAACGHYSLEAMVDGYERSCLAALSASGIRGNSP